MCSGKNSDACSEILFVYNEKCYVGCPKKTMNIAGTNQCVDHCPESSPVLSSRHTCEKYCPLGYVLDEVTKTCSVFQESDKVIDQSSPRGDVYSYVNCSCPSNRPFCYKLHCYKECPRKTKMLAFNGQHCVDYCPDTHPFINDDSCILKCPSSKQFDFRNTCMSSCQKPLFINNTTCLETCPSGLVSHEYVCRKQCPTSSPYVIESETGNVCKEECPATTHIMGYRCKAECPKEQPYLFNRTCVSSCPYEAQYRMRLKVSNIFILVCLPTCPYDRVRDGIFCSERCVSDMVVFNQSCIEVCPNNTYLYETFGMKTCLDKCPASHNFTFENECLTQCPIGTNRINFTDICVKNCSNTDSPFTYMTFLSNIDTCVKDCPSHTFYHNFQCVLVCPKSYHYVYNRTCHEACPEPVYKIVKTIDGSYYHEHKICMPYCPQDWFNDGHECVSKCETSFFANKTCVSECPPEMPYSLQKYSFETSPQDCRYNCPSGMYANGHICVSSCQTDKIYVYNGECLQKCPIFQPFYEDNHIYGKECKKSCDLGQLADGFKCENFCLLYHNSTCVETCPKLLPYMQYSSKGKECRNQCAEGYYLIGENECVSNCWTFKKQYTFDNRCVDKCPDSLLHPFPYVQATSKGKECRNQCTDGFYLTEDKECVSNCWTYKKQYTLQNKCVDKCPDSLLHNFPYVQATSNVKECRNQCKDGFYLTEDKECVSNCWEKRKQYTLENKCFKMCPDSHPYHLNVSSSYGDEIFYCSKKCERNTLAFNFTYTCINWIECNMLNFDGKCVPYCPNNSIQIFNNKSWCVKLERQTSIILLGLLLVCLILWIALFIYCCKLKDAKDFFGLLKRQKLTTDEQEMCLLAYSGENADYNEYTDTMPNDQSHDLTIDEEETCLLMPYSEEGIYITENTDTFHYDKGHACDKYKWLYKPEKQILMSNEDETCSLVPYSEENTGTYEGTETMSTDKRHELSTDEEETCLLVPFYGESININESTETMSNHQVNDVTHMSV